MTILYVVSVFDSALNAFGRPFFVPSTGVALRSFADEVNRPGAQPQENPMNAHPDDFSLYSLGTFDEESGEFKSPGRPELLVRAKDVVQTRN